jgi:MFS family permease
VFDALYPVTDALQKELQFNDTQIGLLDTSYNVAALLTLIAGGLLVDRLGTARSALLFAAIGALGTLGIAVFPALLPGNPALAMAAGRFLLGVGSELFIDDGRRALVQGQGDLVRARDPAAGRPFRFVRRRQVAGLRAGTVHGLAAALAARGSRRRHVVRVRRRLRVPRGPCGAALRDAARGHDRQARAR